MGGPVTVNWRGVAVDPTTAKMLDEVARIVGPDIYLKPLPKAGSYQSNYSASSGTHLGGGAVDLDCRGLSYDKCRRVETASRKVGGAGWFREGTSFWSPHVHVLRVDCTDLSTNARIQVGDYKAGYSGIPIGGRTNKDTGTRAYVGVTWAEYLKQQEDDVTPDDIETIAWKTSQKVRYMGLGETADKDSLQTVVLQARDWANSAAGKVTALEKKVDDNQAAVLAKLAELADALTALGKAPGA